MAAEAISKHFQQHNKHYKPDDEHFGVLAVNGDFAKCKPYHSKRSNIYVHEYLNVEPNPVNCESYQNQLHRHLYNHEIGCNHQHKSRRIKSRSFQDGYISHHLSSSPVHTHSNQNKAQGSLKNKDTITKLEESYWANWRPNRFETNRSRKVPKAHYRVIRQCHSPSKKSENSISGDDEDSEIDNKKLETSPVDCNTSAIKIETETQSEQVKEEKPEEPVVKVNNDIQEKKSEEIQVPADLSQTNLVSPPPQEIESKKDEVVQSEEVDEVIPLKHTDSFILTAKRQSEEKPHYQQPRCIKLFRKPIIAPSGATITRGGSYPLKSAAKKENKTVLKGNIRLGRPGSPILIQTNKGKKNI